MPKARNNLKNNVIEQISSKIFFNFKNKGFNQ